jgi:hypothetical protein
MKKKKKYTIIPVDVFASGLHVWVCTKKEADNQWFKLVGANNVDFDDSTEGKYMHLTECWSVVWIDSSCSRTSKISTMAHELIHACFGLLSRCNINVKENSDEETLAMLHTFLFNRCIKEFEL